MHSLEQSRAITTDMGKAPASESGENTVDMEEDIPSLVAVFVFIDSLIILFSSNLDPGRSGAGILVLTIAFRTVSRSELLFFVVVTGTGLAALVSAIDHGRLKSLSLVSTIIAFSLLAKVMFWGRSKRTPSTEAYGPKFPRSPDLWDGLQDFAEAHGQDCGAAQITERNRIPCLFWSGESGLSQQGGTGS